MSYLVPLVDLQWQHAQIVEDLVPALLDTLDRGQFVAGPALEEFEASLARFVGCRYAVGVGNGTDAIELALRAARLPTGSAVIVPAYTFIATVAATLRAGLSPMLVDVSEPNLLIDPEAVERALTPRVRAIVAVHLFGQMAPMADLRRIADQHGLVLIEDAAQAHGANQHADPVATGTFAACTSFYPGKNLGAYGDAGAVLTNVPDVALAVRRLRDHGSSLKYFHSSLGFNSRLDEIQAIVLTAKLKRLAWWNHLRAVAAARYTQLLCSVDQLGLPQVAYGNTHTWHLYVVRVKQRDLVLERLHERGVGAQVHYPIPPHLQPALAFLGYDPGSFPVSEAASRQVLTLPIFPGLTEPQQDLVVDALTNAMEA